MPTRRNDAPLIVTAHLGAESFAILDDMRRRHFPARLNRVPAHICLFHALPGEAIDDIIATVKTLCRARGSFDLAPQGLRSLGRGVAIFYQPGELAPLHATLARGWADWLSPQDRQPFKPHVTIQNKVTPDAARELLDRLRDAPIPACRIEGLRIWRYLDGPWEVVELCLFPIDISSRAPAAEGGSR